jgi:hypothetical protein
LVTSQCIIIEGVPDANGKEDVWLLHIQSGESKMTGFATGWHAIGILLGFIESLGPQELLLNLEFMMDF